MRYQHVSGFFQRQTGSRCESNGQVTILCFHGLMQVLIKSSLKDLALKLLAEGPHKYEKTARRVRGLFDGSYVFDTIASVHVWEHPYFPQFYIPSSAVKSGMLDKNDSVDGEESAFLATLKGANKSTDRVISFEKGPLAGLVRFEAAALGKKFYYCRPAC